jgi:hypothetical protein
MLKIKSAKLEPLGKGVTFSVLARKAQPLTMELKDIPFKFLLDPICELTSTQWSVVKEVVVIEGSIAPAKPAPAPATAKAPSAPKP